MLGYFLLLITTIYHYLKNTPIHIIEKQKLIILSKKNITRQVLYELVWEHPLKYFTEQYMVSNSSFKKICLDNNIPIPPNGYWSKKKYGKSIVTPLEKEENPTQITLYLRREGDNRDFGNLTELDQKIIEIESDPKVNLSLPKKVSGKLDPILRETKKYLKKEIKVPDNLDYYERYYPGPFICWVSKNQQQRALKIISVLLKNLKVRGHDMTFGKYGSFVKLFGIEIQILLAEKNKKIKFQGKYGEEYRYDPTGDFYIQAGENYFSKVWNDAKTIKLEGKISSIIAWLEIQGEKERLWKIKSERQEIERKEKERLEKERREILTNEIITFRDLYQKSELWHKANKFREFLRAYEYHLKEKDELTEDNIKLLKFGLSKANWFDPTVNYQDEIFKDLDPNVLFK